MAPDLKKQLVVEPRRRSWTTSFVRLFKFEWKFEWKHFEESSRNPFFSFYRFFWFDLPCCFNQLTMVRSLTRYRNHPSLHSTDKRRGKKDKKCIFTRCLVTSAGSLLEEQHIHGLCLNPSHDEPGTRKCMQTVAVIYNAVLGLNSCSYRPEFVQV